MDRVDPSHRRTSVKMVDFGTIFEAGQDYAKQTIRLLTASDADSDKADFFRNLYPDDEINSRFQRIHQTAILRQCATLLKEQFNARFHETHKEKTALIKNLEHDFWRIEKITREEDAHKPSLPKVELSTKNDENPGQVLYQVSDQQVTEYMTQKEMPLPFYLDRGDLNYELVQKAAAATAVHEVVRNLTPGKSLSVLRIASQRPPLAHPDDELLTNAQDLVDAAQRHVDDFERHLSDLITLKERTVFAVCIMELRALYIRERLLLIEELKSWTKEILHKSEKITSLTQTVKTNTARAKRMFEKVQEDFEEQSKRDSQLDHYIKRELHDLSELDGKRLVTMYRKRPHLFRGLKQENQYNGQTLRPRTAELKEQITKEFYVNLRLIEDPSLRPEEIDYKLWQQYNDFRRRKMETEMEYWIKRMEVDLYEGLYNDYVSLERNLQSQQDVAQSQLEEIDSKHIMFERNADLILTLTHGQIEADLSPFADHPKKLILIPLKRIEDMNSKLKAECRTKMKVLGEVVKFREGILLLEWEREVHREKIADYEYEKRFIGSQAAPKEFRRIVGRDFGDYREQQYNQLKKNLKQQRVMFKREIEMWRDKLHHQQQKMVGLENERHNAEASTRGLKMELAERHNTAEDIGVHAEAAESETRRDVVWKQLRLQAKIKQQKKRMEALREELWRWQKKTFPAIYQDSRNM